MTNVDIIRAWKDEEYRMGLTEAERAELPEHPAGLVELTDAQMAAVAGGQAPSQAPGPRPATLVFGGLVLAPASSTDYWTCNSAICCYACPKKESAG